VLYDARPEGRDYDGAGLAGEGGSLFAIEKRPAIASRGMVVTNHPLGSAAGAEMLAGGGNAVDAAVAALFALTVVEPIMVGIFGAGMTHLRLADGTHTTIDNYSVAPVAACADLYRPLSDTWPDYLRAEGDANSVGVLSVGVPGTLKAWCEIVERFGSFYAATRASTWRGLANTSLVLSPRVRPIRPTSPSPTPRAMSWR
jgi:gamma-glutamyltranspeptidase/glutathione hydrolase